MSILKLNGVDIKSPSTFDIEKYNITKSGRVASGKMLIDLIAKKRKFLFNYTVIAGSDMDRILSIIDGNAMFFTLTYEENNVVKTAVCYVGQITQAKFRSRDATTAGWYWKDFKFNLIEQ